MAEGWLRHYAAEAGLGAEVHSAGTRATRVKDEAVAVMREVGIEIDTHASKALFDLPDPWNFDVVLTVCDAAAGACPAYPAATTRLHVGFPDPSGEPPERWREVRDAIGVTCRRLVTSLATEGGRSLHDSDLAEAPSVT